MDSFLSFLNRASSPFHAVNECKNILVAAGFVEISERSSASAGILPWPSKLDPLGKYFFCRNGSSIIAFAVGGLVKQKIPPRLLIVGAHTDSPCLKVKPVSNKEKKGYIQVGVEPYGGGLWHTWFDRDLSVAGRLILQKGATLTQRLVRVDRPILRVPSLAIHLDRSVSDGFSFNKETHLTPVLGLAQTIAKSLNNEGSKKSHGSEFLNILSKAANILEDEEIVDMELCLYDTQPACTAGMNEEFVHSQHLDNLLMSYCALRGLIDFCQSNELQAQSDAVCMIALFDNEEVGSQSAYGAASRLLESATRRVIQSLTGSTVSQLEEKHEENHQPQMNHGVVVKFNANQRYATTAVTSALLNAVAKKCNVPLQQFVVRNDMACGSTIGPILSAELGMRTVDVGNPQLSMHSIREVCGTDDVKFAAALFSSFFESFPSIDDSFVDQ